MKATIKLIYPDESEWKFEYSSEDSEGDAGILLRMVCRGTLMASLADRVMAFDEYGNTIFSFTNIRRYET